MLGDCNEMKIRYEELDSLRGLAALSVLLGHFMLIIPTSHITQLIEFSPLRILIARSEAVTLFFVLSGFVLSIPFFEKEKNIKYTSFLYKRYLRIYLPFYVSLIIAILSSMTLYSGSINEFSSWFNMVWSREINLRVIVEHLLLLTSFQNAHINPVLWSLIHEMRISIIFPLLMLIINRLNFKKTILLALMMSALSFILYVGLSKPSHDYFHTLHYSALFIVGAILARYRLEMIEKIKDLTTLKQTTLLLTGLFLYLYAKPAFALNILLGGRDVFLAAILDTWVVAIGAGIIIMMSLSSNLISKFLLFKPTKFLGKISYSLYLYHCIVLFSFVHLLYGLMSIWIIWIISLIVSFALSALSYKYLELPSINLGRKFNKQVNKEIIKASA